MTCQELVEFLMDYLDGVLADSVRLRFEEHLEECPDCVAYLATYREAVRLGKDACRDNQGTLPEDVPEQLVRAILQARRQDPG
jgi:anti-sigma factor RsiW